MKDWVVEPLGSMLNVQNGFAFNSKEFDAGSGKPLIRIRDLKNGFSTETNFTGEYDEKYLVLKGDLLIGMDGEFGCFEWKGEPALLNQRVCRLQDYSDTLSPRFVLYGINKYLKEIEDTTSYTTVKHISAKQIKAIPFPKPPLPEQERIVAKLDAAFAAIDQAKTNVEQNLRNAKELFQSKLNEVFSASTSSATDTANPEPVEGWVEKKLGEVASFRNGMNFTKSSSGQEIKLVGVADFKQNFWVPIQGLTSAILDGTLNEEDQLLEGDILTVRSNGNQELIGRCMLAPIVEEPTSHSGFTIRIRLTVDDIHPPYLNHFLKSDKARRELIDGGTGVNIKSLSQGILKKLPIGYPDLERQKRIVDEIELLSDKTNQLQTHYTQKLAELEELKKSLLERAFKGEI